MGQGIQQSVNQPPQVVVATFYRFVTLQDVLDLPEPYRAVCQFHCLKGTILLAQEGINGTVAGSRCGIDALLTFLRSDPRLVDLTVKESFTERCPFGQMKVRVKPEIVTLGRPDINPGDRTGTYVEPQDWNQLITDPTVTVIDTRNDYEVQVGTFQGAQNPGTASFRDFPNYVQTHLDPAANPKLALFCTGGIRCEKATAYLLQQGFEAVYHLKGGILNYLETIPPEESLWRGECFVFDERVSVTETLSPGTHQLCPRCGQPRPESQSLCARCEYAKER